MNNLFSVENSEQASALNREFPEGLSVQQILELCAEQGERLTEATFRKYVQLGLLPRSVRVGQKGKRRGSRGLYPVSTLQQLVYLRRLMGMGFTIEEIQREFLFVTGELTALERQLDQVFEALSTATAKRGNDDLTSKELDATRELGRGLITRLKGIEARLSAQARMRRAAL